MQHGSHGCLKRSNHLEIADDCWNKMTVKLCQIYLRHYKLRVSGLKADLVNRIKEHRR